MNPKKPTDTLVAGDGEPQPAGQAMRPTPVVPQEKRAEGPNYDWMGPSLRRMYDDVLNEPIPDSFVDLLKQLHDREKKRQ